MNDLNSKKKVDRTKKFGFRVSWHRLFRSHALDAFEKVEDYFSRLSQPLRKEDEELSVNYKEAELDANEEAIRWLDDRGFEASLIKRIFHAGALLAIYQVVENITKSLLEKDLMKKSRGGFPNWLDQSAQAGFTPRTYPSYSSVNLLRILNNFFKHEDGQIQYGFDLRGNRIQLSDEQRAVLLYFSIDPDQMQNCALFSIPYEDVNVTEFISTARNFCLALFDEAERVIATEPT